MPFNTDTFRGKLALGGARPNQFRVEHTFPAGGPQEQVSYMVKGASLPGMTVGTITLPYFGRQIKVAGDRTYDDWTITVINDETFDLRNAYEQWSDLANKVRGDTNSVRDTSAISAYVTDVTVKQYGKDGSVVKEYVLVNAFPSTIDQIELNWETNDTVEEFGVTFAYDYFKATNVG